MRILAVLCCVFVWPSMAQAQDHIAVNGPVSDEAFYRLVACAARPGHDCALPLMRWPASRRSSLRVGIMAVADTFPTYKLDMIDAAIDAAIDEINRIGADIRLDRVYQGDMDIPIYLLDTPQGGMIAHTGVADLDGTHLPIGRVAIRARSGVIEATAIALSQDIRRREIFSVVLEEIVQSLGLPIDIASSTYSRSIFSETSNSTVWLRGQDAEALRRHYPRTSP